jgi:formylglycine-generating enzyme required for sulfatase activity
MLNAPRDDAARASCGSGAKSDFLKANALGFCDLGGNVGGWILDGFDPKDLMAKRVLCGGAWSHLAYEMPGANRISSARTDAFYCFGFRLARGRL